jgi:hypothetical protein
MSSSLINNINSTSTLYINNVNNQAINIGSAGGLTTIVNGLTLSTGTTLNIGTTGSTSPANIYGLLTIQPTTGNTLVVSSTDSSNSSVTSNSISTLGGIGVSGISYFSNTTDASSASVGGTLTLAGGLGIAKSMYIGNNLIIGTTSTSGTLTLPNTSVNGPVLSILNTTNSDGFGNSGSFTTAGGISVAKSVYVGDEISVQGRGYILNTLYVEGIGHENDGLNTFSVYGGDTLLTSSKPQIYFSHFRGGLITSEIATTVTNTYTVYIESAPFVSGSATITNNYAFYVNSDASYFGGLITANSGLTVANGTTNLGTTNIADASTSSQIPLTIYQPNLTPSPNIFSISSIPVGTGYISITTGPNTLSVGNLITIIASGTTPSIDGTYIVLSGTTSTNVIINVPLTITSGSGFGIITLVTSNTQLQLGVSSATNNSSTLTYYYTGTGSTNNMLQFGLNGKSGLIIDGNNNIITNGRTSNTVTSGVNLSLVNMASSSQIPLTIYQPNLTPSSSVFSISSIPVGTGYISITTGPNTLSVGNLITIIASGTTPSIDGTYIVLSGTTSTNVIINVPLTITSGSGFGIITLVTSNTQLQLGVSSATNNSSSLKYYYTGTGSTNNMLQFGLNGKSGLIIDGNNNIITNGRTSNTISSGINLSLINMASSSQIPLSILQPSLSTSSGTSQILLGTANTTSNAGIITYTNTASTTTNTLSLGLVNGTGNLSINGSGIVNISSTTASTSSTTGAFVVSGGVGIAGLINQDYTAVLSGDITLASFLRTATTGTPSVSIKVGVRNEPKNCASIDFGYLGSNLDTSYLRLGLQGQTGMQIFGNNNVSITSTTASTSTTTGALIVSGGIGVAGNINTGYTASGQSSSFLYSGMATGNNVGIWLGKATTTKNSIRLVYTHSGGDGSNSNFFSFDFNGASNVLTGTAGGNVGIGLDNPATRLHILGASAGITLRSTAESQSVFLYMSNPFEPTSVNKTAIISQGVTSFSRSKLHFCLNNVADNTTAVSVSDARLTVDTNGNVGIGITTPNAPLQFSQAGVNRKIVLYENTNNDHQFYGFGVNTNTLRYQVDSTSSAHVFYAGTGTDTSNELFRIAGNGLSTIGGNIGIKVYNATGTLSGSNATAVSVAFPSGVTNTNIISISGVAYNGTNTYPNGMTVGTPILAQWDIYVTSAGIQILTGGLATANILGRSVNITIICNS